MDSKTKKKIMASGIKVLMNSPLSSIKGDQIFGLIEKFDKNIQQYFKDRDDLILGISNSFMSIVSEEIQKRSQESPQNASKRFLLLAKWLITDRKRTRVFLNLIGESEQNKKLRKELKKSFKNQLAQVGEKLGDKAKPEDAQIVLATLWGLALQHYIYSPQEKKADSALKLKRFQFWLKKLEIHPK